MLSLKMKAKVGDMNKSDQQLGDLWVRDAYDFGLWLYMLFKEKKRSAVLVQLIRQVELSFCENWT